MQLRRRTRRIRAFVSSARVSHRGCSLPLQRAVVDFAADVSFLQAVDKLVEHYGVLLNESSIRRITEEHAQRISEKALKVTAPATASKEIIAEMDGGMIPIVEPNDEVKDRRKGKRLFWKEAKIGLAHAQGSTSPVYGGTVQGDVDQAGQALFSCAVQAGFGQSTHVHALGDGAEWIAAQVEAQFGAQANYLVNFYHVCDYLSAAAKTITTDEKKSKAWIETQKQRLKNSAIHEVLQELQAHITLLPATQNDDPVIACHRYLSNRKHQLDYKQALAKELPIGSGEIESAHRYIVQQRLKRPGAWWRAANAENMLALRINRANGLWKNYWKEDLREAA